MLIDANAVAAAERIRTMHGARVHRMEGPDELDEEKSMPRGVYERAKAAAKPAEPKPEPEAPPAKKRGRKPGVKAAKAPSNPAGGPKFGVFDDGSVTINLPGCRGTIVPQDAREFLAFLARIGVKA